MDRPRAALEALAAYLPELESPGYVAGTWRGGERGPDGVIQMPWFEDSDRGLALRGAIESGVMARILRRLRDLLDAGESPG